MQERQKKSVQITRVFEETEASPRRVVVNVGGARSSKSYSVAQLLVKEFCAGDMMIGVCRKTFPALRITAMMLVRNMLTEYGIPFEENKSEHTITYNGSMFYFFSLDEPEKVKSTEFNYLWMEEANEFTWDDYLILKTRISKPRKDGRRNKIFLSLNPIDGNNWIARRIPADPDADIIRSTYKDNPFLSSDYCELLEGYKNEDENAYRVYALGEWGHLENLIYPNWRLIEHFPELNELKGYGYCLDWGFVAPIALLQLGMGQHNELYVKELVYQTNMGNNELIERMKDLPKRTVWCDSALPQSIAELVAAGWPAEKANKDVQTGINTCRRQPIYITKDSPNVIKEITSYQRKVKDGVVLEEPVKANDHAMDAMRYGAMGLSEQYGFPVAVAAATNRVYQGAISTSRYEVA